MIPRIESENISAKRILQILEFPDESNGDSVNTGDEAGENPYFFRIILP